MAIPIFLVNKEKAIKLKKGWKKPMPVNVEINGQPNPSWKINLMPIGAGNSDRFMARKWQKGR